MCFGGTPPTPVATPAAAPAPPAATAIAPEIGSARQAEDTSAYGSSTPSFRRDDSATAGGIVAGGTGLKMP